MANAIRVLLSDETNPWFNLATEDWIFRELDPSVHVLFLWRNSDTVVIGRHQNPWAECNVQKMEEDGVYLARRQSGGGAVFQDFGNTNFTFLSSSDNYDQEANFQIIIDALATFGITAERSGRNDILVDGRKVSGSAFKHARDRSFHHGTVLLNADLTRLADYLNPHQKKLASKGIKSVRSRVANLVEFAPDISHEPFCQAAIEAFFKHHGTRVEPEQLERETLESIPSLNQYYQQMADWDWRFGNTPDFNHHLENRFDWGLVDMHVDVKRGRILKAKVFSDCLMPDLIDLLEENLIGARYDIAGVGELTGELVQLKPEAQDKIEEFGRWFASAL